MLNNINVRLWYYEVVLYLLFPGLGYSRIFDELFFCVLKVRFLVITNNIQSVEKWKRIISFPFQSAVVPNVQRVEL